MLDDGWLMLEGGDAWLVLGFMLDEGWLLPGDGVPFTGETLPFVLVGELLFGCVLVGVLGLANLLASGC